MKTMTCNQLGGACDKEFHAESWEDMAKQSQAHGAEMASDTAHAQAMEKITETMKDPSAMQKWMEEKEAEFNTLPKES